MNDLRQNPTLDLIKQDLRVSEQYDTEYSFYETKNFDRDTLNYLMTEYDLSIDTQAISILEGEIVQLFLCRITDDWLSLDECQENFFGNDEVLMQSIWK